DACILRHAPRRRAHALGATLDGTKNDETISTDPRSLGYWLLGDCCVHEARKLGGASLPGLRDLSNAGRRHRPRSWGWSVRVGSGASRAWVNRVLGRHRLRHPFTSLATACPMTSPVGLDVVVRLSEANERAVWLAWRAKEASVHGRLPEKRVHVRNHRVNSGTRRSPPRAIADVSALDTYPWH